MAPPLSPFVSTIPPVPPAVLSTQRAALACCTLLVALGLAWELWLAPTGRGTLALKIVPLLAAWPGLWRRRLHTYRWTCLLVWLYVAEGAVRAAGSGPATLGHGLAVLELLLAFGLFAACAAHVRVRTRPHD